ncbi:MAG TPA: hypothetical protein VK896_08110, partial [Gaiellaceae bacterium]|nr:hypothetical protein [Gaiellaceae bacterium]
MHTTLDCPDPVVLEDGAELCVRPLEPGDRETVAAIFAGLGERSLRQRFHRPLATVGEPALDRIASVDRRDRDAVVVFSEDTQKPL